MTKSEYKYLSEIRKSGTTDGKVRVAEIAEHLGVSEVSVYKAMDRLREKEYIADDGKYAQVTLKGKNVLSEYERLVRYVAKRLKETCGLTESEANREAVGVVCELSEKSRNAILQFI